MAMQDFVEVLTCGLVPCCDPMRCQLLHSTVRKLRMRLSLGVLQEYQSSYVFWRDTLPD
jgi:hypothetical protein